MTYLEFPWNILIYRKTRVGRGDVISTFEKALIYIEVLIFKEIFKRETLKVNILGKNSSPH